MKNICLMLVVQWANTKWEVNGVEWAEITIGWIKYEVCWLYVFAMPNCLKTESFSVSSLKTTPN